MTDFLHSIKLPDSLAVAIFSAASVLIIISLLGGKEIAIKEIKVGNVSRINRVIAAVIGIILFLLSIASFIKVEESSEPHPKDTANTGWIFNLDSIDAEEIQLHDISMVSGKIGKAKKAYEFNGQTSYIKVSSQSLSLLGERMTVVAVVDNYGSPDHSGIVANYDNGNNKGFQIVLNTNNIIRFDLGLGPDRYVGLCDDFTELRAGWTFIAYTYSERQVVAYYNENLRTYPMQKDWVSSKSDYLILGEDTDDQRLGENRHFRGAIDKVIIYSRALSKNELMTLYKKYQNNEL